MAKKFKKHTAAEKSRLYKIYENEFALGKTTEEIALDLGVSDSTLYRWQRDVYQIENLQKYSVNTRDVSRLVEVLSSSDNTLSYEILECICAFNAWLRWPHLIENHYHATLAGLFQYVSSKFGDVSLSDLPEGIREGLIRYISLKRFADMCTPDFGGQSDFSLYRLGTQNYTEIEVAANLAWYILSSSNKPHLAGAYEGISAGVSGYKWSCSLSTFRKFWRENLSASPFLFVQTYHSSLTWTLDPFGADYVGLVEELANKPSERRLFFADVQVAIAGFKERVDRRSIAGAFQAIAFPPDLPPSTMRVSVWDLRQGPR